MAIFGLIAATMVTFSLGGFDALRQGGDHTEAHALAQEGLEAVRTIRDRAWNEGRYTTSSVSVAAAGWRFDGENTTETIGDFTRTISFEDVCRDGSDNLVVCPGSYTDVHTKLVVVTVTWSPRMGITNTVQRLGYMTNWDSRDWTQTDWSGGSGQSIWSSATQYDSDDGNVDVSTAGQVTLATTGGGCGTNAWPFTTSSNYTLDSADIEVTGGVAQLVSSGSSITGIADSVVDTLEFDTADGTTPSMVNISGSIYAIAYEGPGSDGYVSTVSIDSSGNIGASVIDTLEFDTSNGETPHIIHISGQIYAIAYEGSGSDGWLVTVDIDSSGNIANSVVSSYEFDSSRGILPRIINISGTTYAITYSGPGSDGFVVTLTILPNGTITPLIIDSLEFDTVDADGTSIVHVSGQIYAIAYNGPGGDGWLATVDINAAGVIANSVTDTYEFDTSDADRPEIVSVSGTTYAVAYNGPGGDGWVVTLTIASNGTITQSLLDSLEFDTSDGARPHMVSVSGDTYTVAYSGPGSDGYIVVFDITAAGTIDNSVIDSLEFDTSDGTEPFIIGVGGNYYAIAYEGPGSDGFLITVEMESGGSYPTDEPSINPTTSFSVSSLDQWSSFSEIATKNGGEIYYQLSDNNGTTWQYWTGSAWGSAGVSDYNTGSVVQTNIGTFSTSSAQINFRAFLESNGTQQVQLDEISISCSQFYDWPFTTSGNYTFDSADIEVTGGVAQLVAGGASISGIVDTVVDTLEFDTSLGVDPRVVHVDGTIYAIVYEGGGNDGFLVTVDVSSSGVIANSVVDSWEWGTSDGEEPDIAHVTGDIYAIVYEGSGNDGYISTVDIDTDGTINKVLIDTFEFDPSDADQPDIIQIDTDTYAIAYNGAGGDGFVRTVDIDASGGIAGSYTDSLEFDTSDTDDPSIIAVSGDIYAIAYNGNGNDGWLVTVDIDSAGNIENNVVDSWEFDTSDGRNPSIVHVSGDIFAVATRGPGNDGFVDTFDIDTDGTINKTIIDTLEFDTTDGRNPELIAVSGDYFLVVYEDGIDSDGFAALFSIQSNGTIGNSVIDTLEFDTGQGLDPFVFNVGTNFFGIAYSGPGNDGWLATIEIETSSSYPTDEPSINPTVIYNGSGIQEWTSFTETATKNGGEIYYQLSYLGASDWMYWTGSAWASSTVATDYTIATTVHTNIASFATSSGDIMFRAFLESDGSQQVQLDKIQVGWGEDAGGGGGSYQTSGYLISSAFDMSDTSPVQVLEWDETLVTGSNVQMQLRTAPDSGGSPGTWTSWYGASGAGSYFTNATGTLVSTALNEGQWVQYRVELSGDGSDTPILLETRVNYK